jgi:hypothetical protein
VFKDKTFDVKKTEKWRSDPPVLAGDARREGLHVLKRNHHLLKHARADSVKPVARDVRCACPAVLQTATRHVARGSKRGFSRHLWRAVEH